MKMKWTMPALLLVLATAGCGVQNPKPVSQTPSSSASVSTTNKPADKTESQKITIHDETIKKENPIINVTYPQIDGMKDTAAQTNINDYLKKNADNVDESTLTNDVPSMPSSFNSTYQISFQNDHLINFIYNQDTYLSGAAHGSPSRMPILVDLDKGTIVDPSELFNGSSQIASTVSQLVKKEDYFNTLQEMGMFKQVTADDLKGVYLTNNGITIFFEPYEYASFADGILQYQLNYSDIQSILNTQFFQEHGIDVTQSTGSTVYFAEGFDLTFPKDQIGQLSFERGYPSDANKWMEESNVYLNINGVKTPVFSVHVFDKDQWVKLNNGKDANQSGSDIKIKEDKGVVYTYTLAPSNGQENTQVKDFKDNIVPKVIKTFHLAY